MTHNFTDFQQSLLYIMKKKRNFVPLHDSFMCTAVIDST